LLSFPSSESRAKQAKEEPPERLVSRGAIWELLFMKNMVKKES